MISLTKRYPYNSRFLRLLKSVYNISNNEYCGKMSRDQLTFKFWNDAGVDRSFSPFASSVHLLFL